MPSRSLLITLLTALCFSGSPATAQDAGTVIYRLGFPAPQTQTVEVEMEVVAGSGELTLHLPTWRPGKYQILDPSGSLSRVEAADANGEPLTVRKSEKSTWKVTVPRRGPVRVSYSIYANELRLRTRHVDATHAFLSGSSVFLYSPSTRALPVRVEFDLPEGWRIAGGLERVGDDAVVAPNYDVLVDSPIEVGEHDVYTYEQNGKSYEIVVWPAGVALDQENLLEDFAEITDEHYDIFGDAPFDRYVFLLHASSGAGGGTEHLNSTIMQTSLEAVEGSFERSDPYLRLLGLTSHEFFHTWNVKALRPDGIQPYDYQRENYSTLFWVAEGTTSYYGPLTLARRERFEVKKYLKDLSGSIDGVRNRPGSRVQSVAESSFDAWVKFNKPSPNSGNTTVSFYRRGALVSLVFDAWVRRESAGSSSLDQVLRTLYERHPLESGGFTEADLRRALQEAAGSDPSELFERYVHGTDELPLEEALATFGLELLLEPPKKRGSDEGDAGEEG
ncbi:MAG: M61 family peptidase, partial [Acidobacteriota bacterium]